MQKEAIPNLNSLLSRRQALRVEALTDSLDLADSGLSHLCIIGVDSTRLGEAFAQFLLARAQEWRYIQEDGLQKNLNDLMAALSTQPQAVLLQGSQVAAEAASGLAAHLLLYRDAFMQAGLTWVIIASDALFRAIEKEAYDLLSSAAFGERFQDQAASTTRDLNPADTSPEPVQVYEEQLAEWHALKRKRKVPRQSKLKKLFRLARATYAISRLEEALKYYEEALKLARKLNDLDYQGYITGNIGLIYKAKGDLDEALKYFRQCQMIAKQIQYSAGIRFAQAQIDRLKTQAS